MKMDKNGLALVAAAAVVLLFVVRKSTAAGAPAAAGQGSVGANAASFWSNAINNIGGRAVAPVPTTSTGVGAPSVAGVSLFGNGTFDASGIYVDPGQVAYNPQTGQVQESPFSGMYDVLSPATYGY